MAVKCQGQHASGSPFKVNIIDPHAVRVHDLQGGVIGEPFSFKGKLCYVNYQITQRPNNTLHSIVQNVSAKIYHVYHLKLVYSRAVFKAALRGRFLALWGERGLTVFSRWTLWPCASTSHDIHLSYCTSGLIKYYLLVCSSQFIDEIET